MKKAKNDLGKVFTEMTTDAQKEVLLNPVYQRLLTDPNNAKTLKFKRDKDNKFYITNYLSVFFV